MSTHPIAKPPVLAEMREVPELELKEYRRGKELVGTLNWLQLACFSDRIGSYWFGAADPSFPEHDRWFYRVSFQELEASRNSWADTAFHEVEHCCTRLESFETGGNLDFVYDLQELQELIKDQLGPLLKSLPPEVKQTEKLRLRRNALLTFQAFGYRGLQGEIIRAPWDQGLHDLVRHPEQWRGANPEFNDLPHDMVLRMHGLKHYADSLATGIDWTE